jgi:MoxR-like ATPase
MQYKSDVEAIDTFVEKYELLKAEIAKIIVGQDEVVKNTRFNAFGYYRY